MLEEEDLSFVLSLADAAGALTLTVEAGFAVLFFSAAEVAAGTTGEDFSAAGIFRPGAEEFLFEF